MAQVGQPAPHFKLDSTKDLKGLKEQISLDEFAGKWLVVLFYPLDFTFVCPTELLAFSDRIEEFKALGAELMGVSTDSKFSHRAWISTPRDQNGIQGLNFPLAADFNKTMTRDYDVLVEAAGIALRGLFIIDPNGVLQYKTVHSLNIGRSVDETLRVLQALQTGGLCPAEWRPGQKTLTV